MKEEARLVDVESAVPGFPAVVSLFADAVRAASVGDALPRPDALEDIDDLLFSKSGLAHDAFSASAGLRDSSHYRRTSFRGGGQTQNRNGYRVVAVTG